MKSARQFVSTTSHLRFAPPSLFRSPFTSWLSLRLAKTRKLCIRVSASRPGTTSSRKTTYSSPRLAIMQTIDDSDDGDDLIQEEDYKDLSILDLIIKRQGWLLTFGIGLLLSAGVVEEFDTLISQHVELSAFVPLIMGHGGNTGSQATCSVIRALALNQVSFRDASSTITKEVIAGILMGCTLGLGIIALSLTTHTFSMEVALIVAISLPLVSGWSNGLGAFLTLASHKLKLDPAMTSAPLMTTIVDRSHALLLSR